MRRYEATMYDSNRWDGFELRLGDIIISTPPKCGTTWTQMICALLILQEPELEAVPAVAVVHTRLVAAHGRHPCSGSDPVGPR